MINPAPPPHYYFETAEVQLDLKPSEEKDFTFVAVPHIREVQIVEEGTLIPGKPMVPAERRLGLEDLFAAEYYDSAASPRSLRAFLEEAGLLKKITYTMTGILPILYMRSKNMTV